MDQLKEYHHSLDTSKLIEYSINQSIHQTSHMLTSESYHHPLSPSVTHTTTSVGQNKKLTSIGVEGSTTASSVGPSESSTSAPLQLHSPKSECSSIESSPVTTIAPTAPGDLHRDHWYGGNHNPNPNHNQHHHLHNHGHHHSHHQTPSFHHHGPLEDLVYSPSSNASKFLDTQDGYLNTRYNVKGGRNERTSVATSFFDIPAATHPYCYRFPSSSGSLLKKDDDGHCANQGFSGNSGLQLAPHFHNKTDHPDSTTNLNHHLSQAHKTVQSDNLYPYNHSYIRTTDSSIVSSTGETELKFESAYGNGYTLRPIDSSIVSSTESELKFESLYANCNPISNNGINQRRGSLQLWQFLVALLDEPTTSCIAWTGRGMEFKLIEPEEVARRWGIQKNRPAMNYDKLSRSLRYYYEKGIMQKVNGERYVYRFVCDPDALFNMAYGHINASSSKTDPNYTSSNSKSNSTVLEQHLNINRETDQIERNNSKNGPLFYSTTLQNHKY